MHASTKSVASPLQVLCTLEYYLTSYIICEINNVLFPFIIITASY